MRALTAVFVTGACTVLLAAGCASTPQSPTAQTAASSTTAGAVAPSPTPASAVTARYPVNADTDSNRADNTIIGGPDAFVFYDWDDLKGGDMFSPSPDGAGATVFTADGGVPVTFAPREGEQATRGVALGVQQEPDAEALAVTAALVRIPADGLTAEKYQIQAAVVDRQGGTVGHVAVEAVEDSVLYGVGLFGDTVVIRYDKDEYDAVTGSDRQYLTAVDVLTERTLWESDLGSDDGGMRVGGGADCRDSDVVGVFKASAFDRSPDGHVLYGSTDGLTAADVRTGEVRWVSADPRCFLGSPEPGGTYPYRIVSYNGVSAYDLRDGSPLGAGGVSYAVDRERGLLAVSHIDTDSMSSAPILIGDGPALQIIDLETGDTVFALDGAEGLEHKSLAVLGAMDGKVWIRSGQDVSVIDAETGAATADSEALAALYGRGGSGIPLYRGDTWMVLGSDPDLPQTILWNSSGEFTLDDVRNG